MQAVHVAHLHPGCKASLRQCKAIQRTARLSRCGWHCPALMLLIAGCSAAMCYGLCVCVSTCSRQQCALLGACLMCSMLEIAAFVWPHASTLSKRRWKHMQTRRLVPGRVMWLHVECAVGLGTAVCVCVCLKTPAPVLRRAAAVQLAVEYSHWCCWTALLTGCSHRHCAGTVN